MSRSRRKKRTSSSSAESVSQPISDTDGQRPCTAPPLGAKCRTLAAIVSTGITPFADNGSSMTIHLYGLRTEA